MVKTCAIPMLICEEAYRLAPGKFEAIRICNTLQSKENPAFVRFARYLDIVNHGVASFEGRFAVYEYMAHHGDCVVSHHWENGQNYLYYEILHGGYPLIHNSEFIRDLGYFYPDFDCQAGGEALIRAFDIHDQNLDDYKTKAAEFLKTLDICHQPNIEAYTDELLALFDSGKTGDPPKAQKKRTSPARIKPETGQGGENSALPAAQARAIDQIHLINLDRRPDRLERFTQSHPELEARFQRFSAHDGKALKLTPALARLFAPNNFNWHKATMGCALSHLALWHRSAETDGENWLILEDDARLLPGWESAITQALKPGVLPEDWEIFFLGGVLPKYRDFFEANVQPLPGGIGRVKEDCVFGKNPPGYFHFCAYSYLLSQRGAKRLLELVEKGNGVWMQADFLAAYTTPDLSPPRPVYFAHPLVAESFQDSEEGFARPYDDDEKSSAKVDSDIWKEKCCFTLEEVAACRSDGLTLDIAGVLAEPEAVTRKKQLGALGEASLPSPSQPIPGIDQIWVINLERRKDRLEKFLNNNPDIAKEVSILNAYDGKKLQLTPKIARLFAPNEFHWNKATMGCSLSHLELWYRLANEPGEKATYLIFEDDTKLTAGWRDIVEQAFTSGQLPQDWDVIYLGGILPKNEQYFAQCKERIAGPISRIVPNGWFGQKPPNSYFHFGAYAYFLGKRGANKLLEFIRLKNGIWPQADMLLAYVTPPGYPVYLKHYFFDPLLAHCYQDLEIGFIKSYADKSQPGKLDSDIWLENEKFDAEHAATIINLQEPYDVAGALADARRDLNFDA
jgi:GR25 family glycosyltransferase involved in LPS biosynthesis